MSKIMPAAAAFDNNVTHERPDPAKRRAVLWVDGLSVFGFHANDKWAEIGFIRPEHSLVEMKIYKKGCKLFWSTKHDFPYSTDDLVITVNSAAGGALGSYYSDGMPTLADDKDFRRMPNLALLHKKVKLPYTANAAHMLSARVRVHDAVFYTLQKSKNKAAIYKNGTEISLGRIGRVLGADIGSVNGGAVVVKIAAVPNVSPEVTITLPGPDQYEIMIRTKPNTLKNHFHHVYCVLAKPSGDNDEFDLMFKPKEPPVRACDDSTKRVLFGEYICETVTGGGG